MSKDLLSVIILWSITFVLLFINLLLKKKIRIIPSIWITFFVVAFAIFVPEGKVLFYLRSTFPVTLGAILLGLRKSAVLCGSFFLSKLIISKNLKLPGKAGLFIRQIFFYYDFLTSKPLVFKNKKIVETIDEFILKIWNGPEIKK